MLTPDLEDNNKRWLVIGICLHSVLTPVLRQYVSRSMNQMYNSLKQSHKIDKQCHPEILDVYPVGGKELNYETVNDNRTKFGSGQFKHNAKLNYEIHNSVDFSKLFFNNINMAQYTGFDETCDSSALLNIIICSDKHPLPQVAKEVRFLNLKL